MWSQSRTEPLLADLGVGAARLVLSRPGTMLAGCSDIYFDRRETIALGGRRRIATPTRWRR